MPPPAGSLTASRNSPLPCCAIAHGTRTAIQSRRDGIRWVQYTTASAAIRVCYDSFNYSMRCLVPLLFCLPALAQPQRFDAAAVERGRAAFKSSCGFCHGEDATGSRAPDLLRSVSLSHDTNGEVVAPIIKNGRPDKGM